MKCPKCYSENPSDSQFCSKCGTQLPPDQSARGTDPTPEDISVPTKTIEAPKEELTTGSTFAGRY